MKENKVQTYTVAQLINLVDNNLAVNASNAYDKEDIDKLIYPDKEYKVIGVANSRTECTGLLAVTIPSNKAYVVTGRAICAW